MPAVSKRKMPTDLVTLAEPTNGAAETISFTEPYTVRATVEGTSALICHRWEVDSIAEKAVAAKGSRSKREDDVESYVYRDAKNLICLPGEYFRQSIKHAAKFKQDPRSPRKSAMDLFNAGVVVLDELCILRPVGKTTGTKDWDYLDRRRVTIQRSGITRVRPAFAAGWQISISFVCLLPEYINPKLFRDVLMDAGRLIGVGDFRPTFGRYSIIRWEVADK